MVIIILVIAIFVVAAAVDAIFVAVIIVTVCLFDNVSLTLFFSDFYHIKGQIKVKNLKHELVHSYMSLLEKNKTQTLTLS